RSRASDPESGSKSSYVHRSSRVPREGLLPVERLGELRRAGARGEDDHAGPLAGAGRVRVLEVDPLVARLERDRRARALRVLRRADDDLARLELPVARLL